MRVHQDFTANVLRGGKPHITTDVREELEGQELSLEEFKHWAALVSHLLPLSLCKHQTDVSVPAEHPVNHP